MKIIIELPSNLIEISELEQFGWISGTVRELVIRGVVDALVSKTPNLTLEDLGITKKEIKERVLEKIVDKAINSME